MASSRDPAILTRADEPVSSPGSRRRPIMKRMGPILRTFWRDLAYQISGLPASILAFTVVVTGLSVAISFAILIVGLPVALGCFAVFRWNARLERKRTAWALGRPIPEAYRPRSGGWLRYVGTVLGDPQRWKDLAWLTFTGTFGFLASVFAITAWTTLIGTVLLPAWYWSLPENGPDFGLFRADTLGEAFLVADVALVLIPLLYLIERWKTEGMVRLGASLLSPTREAALRARVTELARDPRRRGRRRGRRARAHRARPARRRPGAARRARPGPRDGRGALRARPGGRARARRRGARGGQARARRAAGPRARDPAQHARRARPRRGGRRRSRHAARSPPASSSTCPTGCPPRSRTRPGSSSSEALANAGKHSRRAARADPGRTRRAARSSSRCPTTARGGADPGGNGLTGLRKRVEALDGALTVTSPPGGPTAIRAELPCAS